MPTYEYACKSCGQHLEVVQSFKDDALTECPHCGGALRKVFGSIGISFKGSGFYRTDSRAPAKTASKSEAESKSESKGDSKSDAPKSDSSKSESTAPNKESASASSKAESA